jgi:hypothetical protein
MERADDKNHISAHQATGELVESFQIKSNIIYLFF